MITPFRNIFQIFTDFFKNFKLVIALNLMVIVSYNLFLLGLPLTNVLGFEFSLSNLIILSFLLPVFNYTTLRKRKKISDLIFYNILVFIIPLLMGIINIVFIRNCSLPEGILFYLEIVGVGMFFIFTLSLALYRLLKSLSYKLILLFIFFNFIYCFYLIYSTPQLYLYNILYGFFPGFTYDEELNISYLFHLQRLLVLLITVGIVYLFRITNTKQEKTKTLSVQTFVVGLIISLILLGLFLFSDIFGFSTSSEKLKSSFNSTSAFGRINVYFNKTEDSGSEESFFGQKAVVHLRDLEEFMEISSDEKIDVFVFNDKSEKKKLIGTAVAEFAKPWRKEVYILRSNFDYTIRHELAHILAGNLSGNLLKVAGNFNIGLIEGFAMASSFEFLEKTPHEYSALINKFIKPVKPSMYFSGFDFLTSSSSVSYVISGSFCRFLIDKYGMGRFREVYKTGEFQKIYNKSLKELDGEYKIFIESISVSPDDSLQTVYLFGGKSFLKKTCLRFIARRINNAFQELNKGNAKIAQEQFSRIIGYSENPRIINGLIQSNIELNNFDIKSEYTKVINPDNPDISNVSLSLKLLQLSLIKNDSALYQKINKYLYKFNLSKRFLNQLDVLNYCKNDNETLIKLCKLKLLKTDAEKILSKYQDNVKIHAYLYDYLNISQKKWLAEKITQDESFLIEKVFFDMKAYKNYYICKMLIEKYKEFNSISYIKEKIKILEKFLNNEFERIYNQ